MAAPIKTFSDVIGVALDLINTALPVIGGLALLVFIKGLITFIYKAGDKQGRADGKNLMIWGLLALFVMISVYGIIFFFYHDIFGVTPPFGLPLLPTN